jgi:hypothetical protein
MIRNFHYELVVEHSPTDEEMSGEVEKFPLLIAVT